MRRVFEPVTDTKKINSGDITKTMILASKESNNALENLNDKLLEILIDRGKIASYLLSPLSKITNPEKTTQFKLVKNSQPNEVNDLLINQTIPVTLCNNLFTFRDTNE